MTIQKFKARIQVEKRTKIETPTGFTTRHDGYETHEVIVEIDVQRLANMLGPKAVRSKGKRAQEAKGAVTVRLADG